MNLVQQKAPKAFFVGKFGLINANNGVICNADKRLLRTGMGSNMYYRHLIMRSEQVNEVLDKISIEALFPRRIPACEDCNMPFCVQERAN
jgi:hypothetical protein